MLDSVAGCGPTSRTKRGSFAGKNKVILLRSYMHRWLLE